MKSSKRSFVCCLLLIAALSLSYCVHGSGFSILEQSVPGIGRALAGMTAETNDPSAIFFNSASPAWFDKPAISLGSHFLRARAFYDDRGSDGYSGSNGGNMGGWSAIPNLYVAYPVAEGISLGLGISATSGTSTSYSSDWIGRYLALETEIAVVDINPVIAWKVRDDLSIGVGALVQYADVTLSQAVPFGFVGAKDGQMKLEGDSWAAGFTLGALYEPLQGTRFGIGYRSRVTHDLDLDARVRGVPAILAGMGLKSTSSAKADLRLPAILNFGVQQDINEKLTLMGDVSWTEWSVMKDLTVKFDRPVLGKSGDSVEMKWKDCWRFAFGGEYKLTDQFTLRAGVAYDKTPVSSSKHRSVRLPDADRYWTSLGLGYQYTENIRFDLGYTHIFFKDVNVVTVTDEGTLRGKATGSADIFSMGMTYTF